MFIEDSIKMADQNEHWMAGKAKTITFSITEECNLRCNYCYMVGKSAGKVMSKSTAFQTVDYILSDEFDSKEEFVIWEFIGGDPLLEIDLLDQIADYIKFQMYIKKHKWFGNLRFNIATNGLLYRSKKVQNFISKNRGLLSVSISIDGTKEKHDRARVKIDGNGSYDDVVKNIPLWLEQFPSASTKATFSSEDLPFLKDSIIHLWNLGIKEVHANVVYEDVWKENDDELFEDQLNLLSDYIIENDLWKNHSVTFFSPSIGHSLTEGERKQNWCGTGKMLAVDYKGAFYPCIRFCDFTLGPNRPGRCIGDAKGGISEDRLRPFQVLTLEAQSSKECLECSVASGCSFCSGCNYDNADSPTIFQRSTYKCKMHKANARANELFWKKFTNLTGIKSPREEKIREREIRSVGDKYLLILSEDEIKPHCSYVPHKIYNMIMPNERLEHCLAFCRTNNFKPVYLNNNGLYFGEMVNPELIDKNNNSSNVSILRCEGAFGSSSQIGFKKNIIIHVDRENLGKLFECINSIPRNTVRINIINHDIHTWDANDIRTYILQVDKIQSEIYSKIDLSLLPELNILTDRINLSISNDCGAGVSSYTVAPSGKIYACPAFYYHDPDNNLGDIYTGINQPNSNLYKREYSPICSTCDAYQCKRCIFNNLITTAEIHIPGNNQCTISHLERNMARKLLLSKSIAGISININIPHISFLDPLDSLLHRNADGNNRRLYE